jgi:hypothetical protein
MKHNPFASNSIAIIKLKRISKYLLSQSLIVFSTLYSIEFLFLGFPYLNNFEKLIIIIIPFLLLNFLMFYIFHRQIDPSTYSKYISNRLSFLMVIVSIFLSSILLVNNINLIPSLNEIEIYPIIESNSSLKPKSTQIQELKTYNSSGLTTSIPVHKISYEGTCVIDKIFISCQDNSPGKIRYIEFSNNNLEILIQGSPTGAKLNVIWNGEEQIINTYRATEDLYTVVFPYKYSFERQSFFRKLEIILFFISCSICVFGLFLILIIGIKTFKEFPILYNKATRQMIAIGFCLLMVLINILAFNRYQNVDIFALQRVKGNSLIDLDNTSTDNIKNLQVYMNFWTYYKNRDLIAPTGMLNSLKLSDLTFVNLSRAKSFSEINYNPELSSTEIEQIKTRKSVTIMPAGRIPFRFELIIDKPEVKNPICIWQYQGITYFIPIDEDFDCQKEKE